MMKMKTIELTKYILTLICLFSLNLVGCKEQKIQLSDVEILMQKQYEQLTGSTPITVSKSNRYKIVRIQTFYDDGAYNNIRGVYEIVDEKTGKEYFGISGIGISEIGSHSSGKTSASDER